MSAPDTSGTSSEGANGWMIAFFVLLLVAIIVPVMYFLGQASVPKPTPALTDTKTPTASSPIVYPNPVVINNPSNNCCPPSSGTSGVKSSMHLERCGRKVVDSFELWVASPGDSRAAINVQATGQQWRNMQLRDKAHCMGCHSGSRYGH